MLKESTQVIETWFRPFHTWIGRPGILLYPMDQTLFQILKFSVLWIDRGQAISSRDFEDKSTVPQTCHNAHMNIEIWEIW